MNPGLSLNNLKIVSLIALAVLSFKSVDAQTNTFKNPRYLSLHIDNDQFAGSDRYYSAGFKFSWMSKEIKRAEQNSWLNWIPFIKQPGSQRAISLSLGQHIYTPEDLATSDLIENDRPYAGVIYMSLGVHSRTHDIQDYMGLTMGIVGPASGAEQTQSFIHGIFGGAHPQGWKNQLKNEFVISWIYERKWKILRRGKPEEIGFDVIPHLGGGVGNLHTYASGGVQARWGWKLPDEFGSSLSRPGGFRNPGFREKGERSFYLYGGVTGALVLRNIFLDGNTIQESHMVEKIPMTADIFLGLSMRFNEMQMSIEYTFLTKRFKTDAKNQILGSLNLVYSF